MSNIIDICPYREENCNSDNCACPKYKAYKKVNEPGIIEATLSSLGFGPDMEKFSLLMGMQKSFAGSLHKMDNLTKEEMDHWIDKYLVCIEDEVREAREHLLIYPDDLRCFQKNSTELRKEIIDILHFVMDVFLVGGATTQIIKHYYLKSYASNVDDLDVSDILDFAYDHQEDNLRRKYINTDSQILLLTCKLLDACGSVRQLISWKHWKKPSPTIDQKALFESYATLFKTLIDLFIILDMTPNMVKDIYIKKNVENVWRQKFGY